MNAEILNYINLTISFQPGLERNSNKNIHEKKIIITIKFPSKLTRCFKMVCTLSWTCCELVGVMLRLIIHVLESVSLCYVNFDWTSVRLTSHFDTEYTICHACFLALWFSDILFKYTHHVTICIGDAVKMAISREVIVGF